MLKQVRALFALLLICLLLVMAGIGAAQDGEATDAPEGGDTDFTDYYNTSLFVLQTVVDYAQRGDYNPAIFDALIAVDDPLYVAPLLDIAYFSRSGALREVNEEIFRTLAALTGEDFGVDWRAYFEWASENDLAVPPEYDRFKGFLFGAVIDPQFERFFEDVQATANVNLLEAVWGGVEVDGIPSLVNAPQITPEAAMREGEVFGQFCNGSDCSYPAADEFVFGLALDGDTRAYPLRQLNWHEMFNDVIGGVTLYDAPDGEAQCLFRAPNDFAAVERQGEAWLHISGESPGCPDSGWVEGPFALNWDAGDWDVVVADLPDAEAGDVALAADSALTGTIPGRPVMLAYCTLCGAGVLYDPVVQIDGEDVALEFGSTGMLMRSNKLMYDRLTNTVWNAITGEPAFGPLADSGIVLDRLPVVVTDWATWLEEHPDTSVLSLNTGFSRNYTNGAAYSDYFNDPEFIMFPVWQADFEQSDPKDMVFALNIDDTPKAYFVATLVEESVTNDTLAGQDLVIVSRQSPSREFFEPGGATVRAYARGDYTFSPGEDHRQVVDEDGGVWDVTEDALVGPDGETLARLPGHLAFWFGWYAFYPETLVYGTSITGVENDTSG